MSNVVSDRVGVGAYFSGHPALFCNFACGATQTSCGSLLCLDAKLSSAEVHSFNQIDSVGIPESSEQEAVSGGVHERHHGSAAQNTADERPIRPPSSQISSLYACRPIGSMTARLPCTASAGTSWKPPHHQQSAPAVLNFRLGLQYHGDAVMHVSLARAVIYSSV